MGTNFYFVTPKCEHCGRGDKKKHIGKRSAGWSFTFQATEYICSYVDWLSFLENNVGKIVDEYGDEMTLQEFTEMVIQLDKFRKYLYTGDYLDSNGHRFSKGEWS